jgi:hypothetical protein
MAVTEATGSRQLTCDSTGLLRGGPCDLFRVSKCKEPLCGTSFLQVARDRRCRS